LRHLGLDELVANSPAAFVDIALRLVEDDAWRLRTKQEIARRRSALFDDRGAVRALEDALFAAAAGETPPA
jgi:predicted O-linked N-acetylglucosamine transferase (SPINDLY family)